MAIRWREPVTPEDDAALYDALVTADVIATIDRHSGRKEILWKRPLAEIDARGRPIKLQAVQFTISSKPELRSLRAYVDRLKHGVAAA